MTSPKIAYGQVENLWIRMMQFQNAGDIEQGHTHDFDHLTLLSSGKIKIKVNGKETEFVAPQLIYIHKDFEHELTALEAGTVVCCIHALRGEKHGDILSPDMIPNGVPLPKDL